MVRRAGRRGQNARTPGDVVAQALDYSFWVEQRLEQTGEIYAHHNSGESFEVGFRCFLELLVT